MRIEFELETKHGIYRDAITLPEDHALSQTDIEALKRQRADAWVAQVDSMINQPVDVTELEG